MLQLQAHGFSRGYMTSRRHYLFPNPNDKGWESVDGPVQGWRLKALLAVRMTQPF